MKYTFKPNIKTVDVGQWMNKFSTQQIAQEPMVYSGNIAFARKNGGKITNMVIDSIKGTDAYAGVCSVSPIAHHVVIDTRVTMTKKGMYPSIPGWHCDDVPRGTHGQPILQLNDDRVQHFMVILADNDSPVSCTEFVTDEVTIDVDPADVWNSVDTYIEEHKPKTRFIEQGEIIRFNQQAIHRASPTQNPGWRFFFRLSVTHRPPENELRKQVQVYTTAHGW